MTPQKPPRLSSSLLPVKISNFVHLLGLLFTCCLCPIRELLNEVNKIFKMHGAEFCSSTGMPPPGWATLLFAPFPVHWPEVASSFPCTVSYSTLSGGQACSRRYGSENALATSLHVDYEVLSPQLFPPQLPRWPPTGRQESSFFLYLLAIPFPIVNRHFLFPPLPVGYRSPDSSVRIL